MNYTEVKDAESLSNFFDLYRGSGLASILSKQLHNEMLKDDARAFSAFNDFLNAVAEYKTKLKGKNEINDDFLLTELAQMISAMTSDPDYADYQEFLADQLENLQDRQPNA